MAHSVQQQAARACAVGLLAVLLAAGPPSPQGSADVGLSSMGGLYGGEVHALAVSSHDPRVILAATAQGIFRTTDAGERWWPASAGLRHVRVHDITFDVVHPTVAYAATNGGVFHSADGGLSWAVAYEGSTEVSDPAIRVVSTVGALYASTFEVLLASYDQGITWDVVHEGVNAAWRDAVMAMGAAPSNADLVYLSRNAEDGNHDLLRTQDGGATWETLGIRGVIDVEVHPENPEVAYVSRGGELAVTRDGGESWTALWSYNLGSVREIALSAGQTVVISGNAFHGRRFVARSEDGGVSWKKTLTPGYFNGHVVEALALDPTDDLILYYGGSGRGLYRSTDGGVTLTPRVEGMTAYPVRGIATDPTAPSRMYATLGEGGFFRSDDGGTSWVDLTAGLSEPGSPYLIVDVTTVAVDAAGALYVTRETDGAADPSLWVSSDHGTTWTSRSADLQLSRWIEHLVAHPTLPGHLVVTSWQDDGTGTGNRVGGAFRTQDGGETWSEIPALEPAVTAVASDGVSGRLLAATYGGSKEENRLLESVDFGETWHPLAFPLPWDDIYALAVDARTGRLYAGGTGPLVAHSDDGGATWTTAWIPLMRHPERINVIAVDPVDITQVFLGTQGRGLWFSRDRGVTWLPTSPGVDGHEVYAVMFPVPFLTPLSTAPAGSTDSIFLRYRAAYVGAANGTRSGLERLLPRPHNRRRPDVSGRARVGRRVRCDPGRWTRARGYRYRWLRDSYQIPRARTAVYEVRRKDVDHRLRCRVIGVGPGGRDEALSWRRRVH